VDELDDAVHHGVAQGDQREDGPAREAVDRLLDEHFPPRHLDGGPRHGPPYPPVCVSIKLGARSRQRRCHGPHTPRPASRSSWGLDRVSGAATAPIPPGLRLDRAGGSIASAALPRPPYPPVCVSIELGARSRQRRCHDYSRMVSNWNLQPIGPSAFTTLKPDMVS